jgi:hypothetical protein
MTAPASVSEQDTRAQLIGLHEPFHEGDLVEARGQEKAREFRKAFLAQMTPAVEVVAPRCATYPPSRYRRRPWLALPFGSGRMPRKHIRSTPNWDAKLGGK